MLMSGPSKIYVSREGLVQGVWRIMSFLAGNGTAIHGRYNLYKLLPWTDLYGCAMAIRQVA
jgi:hypothetical protein